ncbi:hypothetical protein DFH07DRAFT_784620 [Mycena maculata]|uniref:Uncharacterized protein n=1 Tax=Mycena maculata TaxID=230809 RepID=A0AAD7HFV6_9AGAR|nr:hypothetical protein DFH07DRAFT_784620 [Mycena maculata]
MPTDFCRQSVVEAGISFSGDRLMEDGSYGFAMISSDIALVRDLLASNSDGEICSGYHVQEWWCMNGNTAIISRLFPTARLLWEQCASSICWPTHSWHSYPRRRASRHFTIGLRAHKIFEELILEKDVLAKAISSLNTVRKKGRAPNVHIIQLQEDDCEEN